MVYNSWRDLREGGSQVTAAPSRKVNKSLILVRGGCAPVFLEQKTKQNKKMVLFTLGGNHRRGAAMAAPLCWCGGRCRARRGRSACAPWHDTGAIASPKLSKEKALPYGRGEKVNSSLNKAKAPRGPSGAHPWGLEKFTFSPQW